MNRHWIDVGYISGVFGLNGWVKVFSYTEPRGNILNYSPWFVGPDGERSPFKVVRGRSHGKGLIACLEGVDCRDAAGALAGSRISIPREQLRALGDDEYYWTDLVGLQVRIRSGETLGRVVSLMETGANDVLVVQGDRERLIPFLRTQVVEQVDLDGGTIWVNWDPDF